MPVTYVAKVTSAKTQKASTIPTSVLDPAIYQIKQKGWTIIQVRLRQHGHAGARAVWHDSKSCHRQSLIIV